MIILYFMLFIVIRSNQMTDIVDFSTCLSEMMPEYTSLEEYKPCVNCFCRCNNETIKYSTEFCLPANKKCKVLNCCTCKYFCEKDSWGACEKCKSKMVYAKNQTHNENIVVSNMDKLDEMVHENQDNFNISNSIEFLLIVFIGLFISLIVLLLYSWKKSRDHHGDFKEIPRADLNSNQTDDNSQSSTVLSSANRENSNYIIPSHFELNELVSLFQTYSLNDVPIPSQADEQTTRVNSDSN